MTTSDAKIFARYLRFTGWNYDDGGCGNDVVIFVATKDRQVRTISQIGHTPYMEDLLKRKIMLSLGEV